MDWKTGITESDSEIKKFSLIGAVIALGIVFGDLGTSPLYTLRAIITGGKDNFNELLIYGGLSCIFWTLTLSTTVKYVIIALTADNNGEGGIFALIALIKEKSSWAAILTMIGAAALLADGVITPAITVTSSIEGLKLYRPDMPVVPIVLCILTVLFFIQQFGTNFVGKSFGPIMIIWFLTLSILGLSQLILYPDILKAANPAYAYRFLAEYPGGFILLGAVFLCTTGAEALYADLGHCGKTNIRVTWGFVKTALLLNYFGQGAWLMMNFETGFYVNPFFEIMPRWFLIPGVILATSAAIIASQAIITGSYTLISEAISLNFWPKMRVLYPTWVRGQVYLPGVNWFLWIACSLTVLFFKESSNMNAAYGLAINIAEIMTTLLLSFYLFQKGINHRVVLLLFMIFITIEGGFLIANLYKFKNGGWFALILASLYFLVMYGWYYGRKIKNRYITFADLDKYLDALRDLSKDESVPRFATNLVYVIRANRHDQVESKVIYSIFHKQPKRADTYWFLHVNKVNEPNSFKYQVKQIIPGVLIRVDFHIGFKVIPKINLYFKEVLEDLKASGEISLHSSYDSLRRHNFEGDFKFILIDRIMSRDNKLSNAESFILSLNSLVRKLSITDLRTMNLDPTNTIVEQVPIIIDQPVAYRIKRVT
ncbi:MAG TPA: KUP/HAK/KT family potassium transporter [Bacteroidales bacterium]|jgi:KUP system potassium uptake protein|nr:potassium transporter Kup [Bacteroidales bacterium]OQB61206.1 MAG: potassium transport protein Kup [Bacteroidetes bacterium ADurb.Bin145]HOU02260.1 KUP/HAK/KT family potassium transporter [Bacteroidales bacterium]HQG62257.1 KUP/HAK/KT family potassium transporter [Bacteroidales bacterium]HQK68580.1 KUP/HAK/KT family potassium transporter [Bacteroidales bacterium]